MTAALVVSSCSGGEEAAPTTSAAAPTTTVLREAVSDGRLTIGVLLPTSDAVIGDPMVAAVEEAVSRINVNGGVFGKSVRTVIADEGSTTASASNGIRQLLSRDVDAIVGPGSSLLTLGTLEEIISSGILACSPTASAIALDDFPDDGLFFRTVPSDSLQAAAIAQAADQTGALTATIVHADDGYGRAFARAVEDSLDSSITVTDAVTISGRDDDLTGEARRLVDLNPQVVIILADGDDATRFLETLDDFDTSNITTVIVNDALRNPSNPQLIADFETGLREKIVGLAPQISSSVEDMPFDPPGPFAVNAFDCVNLIALSAVRAGSDAPHDIAAEMAPLSASGQVCASFAECVKVIDSGRQIDYNGPSGLTELDDRTGDPQRAMFDRFIFGPSGADVYQRTVVVGR